MRFLSRFFMALAIISLMACAAHGPADNISSPAAAESSSLAASNSDSASTEISENRGEEELICRREVVTGTNFRRKVCNTRAELEEASRQSQELLDYQRTRTSGI